jgi:hypothetical protein
MDPVGEAPMGALRGGSLERRKKNREEGLYWVAERVGNAWLASRFSERDRVGWFLY